MAHQTEQKTDSTFTSDEVEILAYLAKHPDIKKLAEQMKKKEQE